MKVVAKTDKFVVIDDVLPSNLFEQVWISVQNENYSQPNHNGNWVKVWRINDGIPYGTTEYHYSKKPFNNYIDAVGHVFLEIAKNFEDVVSNWNDLILRTYLYPRNTKLSWHNDANNYLGAFTYYVHPYWSGQWAGELMIFPETGEIEEKPKTTPHLDHRWEDKFLLEKGIGTFISPKPNRCVLMKGGTYHAINRVDSDAGDHCRCSIVGFLVK